MSYSLLWGNELSVHVVHGLNRGGTEMPEITPKRLNLQKQYWEKPKQLEPNLESCGWFYTFPIWLKKRLLMNLCFHYHIWAGKAWNSAAWWIQGLKIQMPDLHCTIWTLHCTSRTLSPISLLCFCWVQVFRVVSVCLGSPPETICWEFRDKDKTFHCFGPLTPKEFYIKHVKPLYNLQDKVQPWTISIKHVIISPHLFITSSVNYWLWSHLLSFQVCLVNDPRPQNPFGKLYSVEYLGNMVGGRKTLYNNQPIELLKKATADSIKDGEVWCRSAFSRYPVLLLTIAPDFWNE